MVLDCGRVERRLTMKIGRIQVSILFNQNARTLQRVNFSRSMQSRATIIGALVPYPAAFSNELLKQAWIILEHNFVNCCVALLAQFLFDIG